MRYHARKYAGSRPVVDARALAIGLVVVGLLLPLIATAKTYQEIRVPYPEGRTPQELFFHPDLELMGDDDGAYRILSTPELTEQMRARGFEVEIVVPDLEAHYAALQGKELRDYGIWHTFQETVDEMNLLHVQYPNLTTTPSSIGTTGEGRTLWAMKISDNPNVQESEPEVLFDGMHHAREIMTVEVILHFMRYLCENYGTDPVVTFLVDNRQIWFVPLINPDGFVYNEQTNPNGGGMWRKNRRVNGGGCYGVDLNRNYPYEWVGPGSSSDPCSDTYRGPLARSEPEIIGLTGLVNAHTFVTWQSYHSVAGMVLIPWGYTTAHTPDDAVLRSMANTMAAAGGYDVGQAPELLYAVNGVTGDWAYGATNEHAKIFPFTTEISGSGFWPAPAERDGLIAENLYSNIYLCQVAGSYLALGNVTVVGGDGNGRLDPGETAGLSAVVSNPGVLVGATNARISVTCDDPYVTVSDAQSTLGNIAPGGSANNSGDPFDLSVSPSCPAGRMANFRFVMEADGGLRVEETRSLAIGQPPILYSETFEAATAWAQDPTHTAISGAWVRVDPVATNYQPGDDTTPAPGVNAWITGQNAGGADGTDDVDEGISAARSGAINLSGISHARLNLNYFHGQRDAGDDATDGFRIDLSNDGGATFPVNLLLIGDVSYAASWRNLQVDLEDYLPLTAQMMLRVQAADPGPSSGMGDIVEGGLDDIYVYNMGAGNEPPSAPVRLLPADGAPGQPPTVALVVQNAVDPEGDPLTYGFRVYSDALLTQVVASVDGVVEGSGQTSWNVNPPLANGTYYWRAFAADAHALGLFTTAGSFGVVGGAAVPMPEGMAASFRAGPNPARGPMALRYHAPAAVYAKVEIFDLEGRRMRTLEGPRWSDGWQEVIWDGLDGDGHPVPAGTYWVRLETPVESRTLRVVQVK